MSDKKEDFKFEALNQSQLDYAHELLEELHPIDDTPLCIAFPTLGCFTMCGVGHYPKYRKDQEAEENHSLDKEGNEPLLSKKTTMMVGGKEVKKKSKKKKKNNIQDQAKFEAEPLARLGFGIVAYTDILWTMIVIFAIFSLLLAPTMSNFHKGTGYKNINPALVQYEEGMIGNMGFSSVQCASIPVDVKKLNIMCPFGTIGKILDQGINQEDADATNCASNTKIEACKPNSTSYLAAMTAAIGTESHLYSFPSQDLWADQVTKDKCYKGSDSRLFIQYTCEQTLANQHSKYNQMCLAVATAMFIALFFTISIRYMYQGGKMKQIDWDMSTITAGDYSVEFTIPKDAYQQWKNTQYEAQGGPKERDISPALALKQYMSHEIEQILDDWVTNNPQAARPDDGMKKKKKKKVDGNVDDGKTKVADVVFSYNNRELILALRARGACIAKNDFKALITANTKVQDLMQDFDSLTIPTAAFITFESDDSKEMAMDNESDKLLLGQEFRFVDASEPTDIIWENRLFTSKDYIVRQLKAFLIIAILLAGSFGIIFAISGYSAKMAAVFPPQDCAGVEEAYGTQLERYANDDFDYIANHLGAQSSGTLQCFCQKMKKEDDAYAGKVYGGRTDEVEICAEFDERVGTVYYWTTALSYLLIGINYILRTVCIMLIDWVGFPTETTRLSKTTSVTFWVQFFNSGFLLLLVNANMSEQPFSFGLSGGSLADFSSGWYRGVGNIIIGAMFFNLYYPLLEAGLYWAIRAQGRCRDRGCSFSGTGTKTKQTSVQAYMDVYSGPVYYMHYKYSSIMTNTFITFMYGFGMPILFPLACVSFIVLYTVEKWLLFYGYRLPPMYDERLSQDVLNKLQFAPILYLAFGYWMCSNQQLLSNDNLQPMTSTTDCPLVGHSYGSIFSGDGWSGFYWVMLLAFICLLLVFFFGKCFERCIAKCLPSISIGDIELNEAIDNYWASLDDGDRKWSLREEENARSLLTSALLTDTQFQRLQTVKKTKGHTLQGVHSYDILANPLYLDDFQYVTAAEDDRDQMIIDDDEDETNDSAQSDLVRVMINLAYLTENEAKAFQFTPQGLKGCNATPSGNNKGYQNPLN